MRQRSVIPSRARDLLLRIIPSAAGLLGMILWAHAAAAQSTGALRTGEHDVVVNGVRLWYRVAGTSKAGTPPVLFLHGGPGYNSYSFAALEGPLLEKSLRMI